MTIRHVATGALAAAAATSVSVTLPSGILPGDLIVIVAGGREDNPADSLAVSGYTAIGNQAFSDFGTSAITLHAFYKFASGTESNPTITGAGSATGGTFGYALVYRGVDPVTPFDGVTPTDGIGAAIATLTPSNITPGTNNAWIVSLVNSADDNNLSVSTTQSFNTRASGTSYHTTTGLDIAFAATDKEIATPASTTLPTYTQNAVGNDTWAWKTFVLRAAIPEWEELFNGAVDGTAISTSNSTLTGVGVGTGTTTFETDGTVAPNGQRYCRITTSATTEISGRTIVQNAGNKDRFRFYFRASSIAAVDFWRLYDNAGATVRVRLDMSSGGAINIRDVNTTRYTSTKTLAAHEWVRIEVRVNDTNDTLSLRLFWGANIHGTTADEEATGLTWTAGNFDEIRFGAIVNYTGDLDYDAMAWDPSTATDWIGPVTADANEVIRLIEGTRAVALSNTAAGDVVAGSTTVTIDGSLAVASSATAAGTVLDEVSGSLAASHASTATADVVNVVDGSLAAASSGTAAATVVNDVAGSLAVSVASSAAADVVNDTSAAQTYSQSFTASATVENSISGSLAVASSGTAGTASNVDVDGTLAVASASAAAATIQNDIAGAIAINSGGTAAATVVNDIAGTNLAVSSVGSGTPQREANGTASQAYSSGSSATAGVVRTAQGSLAVSSAGSAAGTVVNEISGSLAVSSASSAVGDVPGVDPSADLAVSLSNTAAASVDNSASGSLAVASSSTAAASVTNEAVGSLAVGMSSAAAASVTNDATASLPVSMGNTAVASVERNATATLLVTVNNTAALSSVLSAQGSLAVAHSGTAAGTRVAIVSGSLAVASGGTGTLGSILSVDGSLPVAVAPAAAAAVPTATPTIGQLWPRGGG